MKQWSFLLVNGDIAAALAPLQDRPTGETVEVEDNDGNTIVADVMTGGWSQVASIGAWHAVLAVSTAAGYAALLPHPAVTELVRMTRTDDDQWPELDVEPDEETVDAIDSWLLENNFDIATIASNLDLVNGVFGLFVSGFNARASAAEVA